MMTHWKALFFSIKEISTISAGMRVEKINIPIPPIDAATSPLPPSRNPNAFPCLLSPPQFLVALIIADQNKKVVEKPQKA